jgi:hypothetical protein
MLNKHGINPWGFWNLKGDGEKKEHEKNLSFGSSLYWSLQGPGRLDDLNQQMQLEA